MSFGTWLYEFFFGKAQSLEKIDNLFAKPTTPDEIIENAVINSIAKNFDDWTLTNITKKSLHAYNKYELKNSSGTKVVFHYSEGARYFDSTNGIKVNGVQIEWKHGEAIVRAYYKIKTEQEEVKKKAAEALKLMKETEKKWNVAESILGMKRDENGALRVKVEVE